MPELMHDDVGPLGAVRKGMRVVDSAGQDCGTVDEVQMGDQDAVTGPPERDTGLVGDIAEALTGHDELPDQLQARLRRVGYLRLDTGLLSRDVIVPGDAVTRVDGDVVHLDRTAAELPHS